MKHIRFDWAIKKIVETQLHQKFVASFLSFLIRDGKCLKNREKIFLHGQALKDGPLLGQIPNSPAGTTVHGHGGHILAGELGGARGGANQADQHVETGGFASPVGTQKAYDLSRPNTKIDPVNDVPLPVALDQTGAGQEEVPGHRGTGGEDYFGFLTQGAFCSITRLAPSVSILSSSGKRMILSANTVLSWETALGCFVTFSRVSFFSFIL